MAYEMSSGGGGRKKKTELVAGVSTPPVQLEELIDQPQTQPGWAAPEKKGGLGVSPDVVQPQPQPQAETTAVETSAPKTPKSAGDLRYGDPRTNPPSSTSNAVPQTSTVALIRKPHRMQMMNCSEHRMQCKIHLCSVMAMSSP